MRAAFSPDGSLFAAVGDDQTTSVWDVATGELRDNLRGHSGRVSNLAFTPDSATLMTIGQDGNLITWDVRGDRSFGSRPSRQAVFPAAAGTVAYLSTADGASAGLIDLRTGRLLTSFGAFYAANNELVTTDVDARIRYEAPRPG